jgi:2-polyprenyl-3-methyl-5-hydroxy-6-metoxy-1,4-benzoquinol methylase
MQVQTRKQARMQARIQARDYWRCPACQATFLEPSQRPDRAAEAAYYRLHRNEVADSGYRRLLSRLAEPLLARVAPGQSGLDYGCGPGPALAAMLTEAGHRMALYDPQFRDDPSVLLKRYDFITCTEVAEHFHRPHEEFERLGRLLRPGGWLAVMTAFQTDDTAFARWHYRRDPTHVVFYREATFHAIAGDRGWRCAIPCADVALLQKPAG